MDQNAHNDKLTEAIEKLDKLENYIKVTGYEEYKRINYYTEEIGYSEIDYLKKNKDLREQLEHDFRMMSRARLRDDFLEFCRYATLQIELIIDQFIEELERGGKINIERGEYNKIDSIQYSNQNYKGTNRYKIQFCLDFMRSSSKGNENIIAEYNQYKDIIDKIFRLRNLASHRGASPINIEYRLERED